MNISDINKDLKLAMGKLYSNTKDAMHDILKLAKQRQELLRSKRPFEHNK